MTSETARRTVPRALAAPVSAPGWLATISVGWSLVVSGASFFALLVLMFFAVPLMLLALVGLPLLWIAFGISRGVAEIERWQSAAFLGADLPLRPWARSGSLPSRMWQRTKSRGTWLELVYALVVRPLVSLAGAVVVFGAWGGGLGFVLFPVYGSHTASHGALFGWSPAWAISNVVHLVIGIGLLLAAPWLARGTAAIQFLIGLALLAPNDRERLETRVETLQDTRSRMVAAADAERRRIERDLHDGAQQRLVALAMTLGRAKVATDPELTAALVSEAHDEAKLALGELRDLARGIHPAVLTDRGLDAALSALAARSPIPVYVTTHVPRRPTPGVEAVAYFIAAEALTNVHKHAGARQAWITVDQVGDRLQLEIIDDGHGGADFAAGTGLIGLRDRARAIDGELTLISPPGGPTRIRVELPCGAEPAERSR